ncbi:hypothetical protein PFISCL1PPCAC_22123, partial [Pristionchus fissidentatus]
MRQPIWPVKNLATVKPSLEVQRIRTTFSSYQGTVGFRNSQIYTDWLTLSGENNMMRSYLPLLAKMSTLLLDHHAVSAINFNYLHFSACMVILPHGDTDDELAESIIKMRRTCELHFARSFGSRLFKHDNKYHTIRFFGPGNVPNAYITPRFPKFKNQLSIANSQ